MTPPAHHEDFLALVEDHKKILHKVANSYCRNPADRPDLIQEIVLQPWRSFHRNSGTGTSALAPSRASPRIPTVGVPNGPG